MPINMTGRSISTGNLSPMIPVVANNPAFKVAILPVDGRFEQPNGVTDDREQQTSIKIGDYITGEVSSGTKLKGKAAGGQVVQVLKNNQEIVGYKIIDANGKDAIIDPTSAVKADHTERTNEMFVLSYESWLAENQTL
jgi:hypothetical protein